MQTPVRRSRAAWLATALAAACLASLLGAPAAGAASRFVTRARTADALRGTLLLTRCPKGWCHLYTSVDGGKIHKLPIKTFGYYEDAYEASLGIGPHGHMVATYPRCSYSLKDCDLYVYDFATQHERRLPVSHVHAALTGPTVSGDRIAYNFDPKARDRASSRFDVRWSRLGSRKMHSVSTMPFALDTYLPTLDLSGKRLAYSGYSGLTSCLDQSQVRITKLGKRHGYGRLIARGTNWTDVFSPNWSGNSLYFGRDYFTRSNARHGFTPGEIKKSRIERHLPGAKANRATDWGRAAMRRVLPDGKRLMFAAVSRKNSRTGVYEAMRPSYRAVKRPW